jgi:murein L,D-transpeptidase YafK
MWGWGATRCIAIATLLWLAGSVAHAHASETAIVKADKIVVLKAERRLMLMRSGEILMSYRMRAGKVLRWFGIALGRDPVGAKVRQGDGRTPEGLYVLDWRNPRSRFYRSIHISYPGGADRERARRLGASPGGDIMIHGLPNGLSGKDFDHARWDWTEGCIAVTNAEMDDIWARVDDGTAIEILP